MHVPRDLQERALAVSRATQRPSHDLGHSPTIVEIAEALDYTLEEVLEATEAAHSYAPTSLDAPVASGEDVAPLSELLGREDEGFDLVARRGAIAETWRSLPKLERQVVSLRFAGGLTQREIGQRIGYSQMHVSRMLRRALSRLIAAPGPE